MKENLYTPEVGDVFEWCDEHYICQSSNKIRKIESMTDEKIKEIADTMSNFGSTKEDSERFVEVMENKPKKLLNFLLIVLFYIVGVIDRAFLVPFIFIDSLSTQSIMELSETNRERYHREVKNVIYRMVFIAVIAGIWFIFKIIRFFFA